MRKVLALLLMIRNKGPRLVVANVMERIVFDVLHGVDTITQVPKDAFPQGLANVAHGLHYSSSWTSEIRFGFDAAKALLGQTFEDYAFIDIGCGKGKVQIVWEGLLRKHRIRQRVYGIDYMPTLIDQAKANFRRAVGRDGSFIHADAGSFDYAAISRSLILYLYNPFDEVILARMLDAVRDCDVLLIYNNPVHADVLLRDGFRAMRAKPGFHPQAETTVYTRRGGG